MLTVNQCTILGNVGKDPEFRELPSGDLVAKLAVATQERWKDPQTGEMREKTDWHKVAVYNKVFVKVIQDRVQKGDLVYIQGRMQTHKYEDETGAYRHITELAVSGHGCTFIVLY